jgi:phage shock protein PspC (stress-responsive transcriptional regulator)
MSTHPTDPDDPTDPTREHDAPDAAGLTREHDAVDDPGAPAPEHRAPSGDPAPPPADRADAPGAPGLFRSSDDRMLFGVCAGIAERYGFEPLLVRLAFLATLFIGGAGVLFYLAAALLIPPAPSSADGLGRRSGPAVGAASGVLRVLVAIAAGIGVLAGLGAVAAVSLGLTAMFGAWPVAVVLLVVAVLLVVSARSRTATASFLVLALALAVPATAATLSDLRVDRTFGERSHRPATLARAAQGYRLGFGELTLNLRSLPLEAGDRVRIPVHMDAGELRVLLPAGDCVAWTVRTRLTAGDTEVLSSLETAEGLGTMDRTIEIDPPRDRGDRRPRVVLDLQNRLGEVVVGRTPAALRMTGEGGGGGVTSRGDEDPYDDVLRTTACRAVDRARERARG